MNCGEGGGWGALAPQTPTDAAEALRKRQLSQGTKTLTKMARGAGTGAPLDIAPLEAKVLAPAPRLC